MSDEYETSISIPLDEDRFLRRECPTCEREFKVFVQQDDGDETDEQSPPPGGYFCPYCAIQADPNSWFTKAQLELAQNKIMDEVVGPMLDDFKRRVERAPGVSVNLGPPQTVSATRGWEFLIGLVVRASGRGLLVGEATG